MFVFISVQISSQLQNHICLVYLHNAKIVKYIHCIENEIGDKFEMFEYLSWVLFLDACRELYGWSAY